MKPMNLEQPHRYSRAEIVRGLKYIADALGSLMSADELDAEIQKAKVAASGMPVPDAAAFKTQVLEHLKRGRDSSDEKIIEFRATQTLDAVPEQNLPLAHAARTRKRPWRRRAQEKRVGGGHDGPAGA